ncbi:glycosyltransferase family 4 protein [Candidatus Kaiserbacteria bacterium]|nr:glycosyltransferase family 4 protein [Candidatus Kaiserbacteria bacterium]
MRLLIVTQTIDENDPILGFFCRWIEELAKHFETISIIALTVGSHHLPENVSVYSLGKEKGGGKVAYTRRFVSLAWSLRSRYDAVLVHMNPEYVILAGLLWRALGKKISLWYNHPHFGARFATAALLSQQIFYTSPYAAPAHLGKALRMPAGIDTELFKPTPIARDRNLIYAQGRITPSKHTDTILEALRVVRRHAPVTLMLVGPEDTAYGKSLRRRFNDLVSEGAVIFKGPLPNSKTPALYAASGLSVNLAAAGHYDKSVLESMACETPVLVGSQAFSDMVPPQWVVTPDRTRSLPEKMEEMLSLPEADYRALGRTFREAVVRSHDVKALGEKLSKALHAV